MTEKIIELLKDGSILIPKILLKNYKNLNITPEELVVLIYLIQNNDFNPEKISKDLSLSQKEVLNIINSLTKKDIIKLKSITKNKLREEYISLDELYNKLTLSFISEENDVPSTNLYDIFQKEFGRQLSSMEYEIIGAWLEDKFSEELILLALKEAVYNGVHKLNYIDKILYEWRKKGIKDKADIEKERKNRKKESKKEVYDYDWLNE